MSSYWIARRAYPTDYWAAHGDEIVDTANELHNTWSFRESRQLVSNGLRTRSFEATGGDVQQVWVQGLTIFLLAVTIPMIGSLVGFTIGLHDVNFAGPDWSLIPVAIGAFAMTFSTRWPVMFPMTAAMATSAILDESSLAIAVPISLFVASIISFLGNGRPVFSPKTFVVLVLATTLTSPFDVGGSLAPILLLVVGLAIARFDARVLAAFAILSTSILAMAIGFVLFPDTTTTFVDVNSGGRPISIEVLMVGVPLVLACLTGTIVMVTTRRSARHLP